MFGIVLEGAHFAGGNIEQVAAVSRSVGDPRTEGFSALDQGDR